MSRDYCAIAAQYVDDVLSGNIPACKWVIKACERYEADRARANTAGFPFRFDTQAAAKVCKFVEYLPHIEGELAGQLIHLEPWQVFLLTEALGWRCVGGKRDGKRRYRRVYIEVPRGNGKSCLASGVALYMLCADGEGGAQVYSAATTHLQASIVFKVAKAMIQSGVTSRLAAALGINCLAQAVTVPKTNSSFTALNAQGKTLDGLNIHCAIVDEVHAHPNREVWDVVVTGAGKRQNSMIFAITTAGFDFSSVGYEQHEYLRKILDGVATDESVFGVIWSIDDGDDWQKPECWAKANPNYGVSVNEAYFEGLVNEAISMPAKQPNFLTKSLNVWVANKSGWANMDCWRNCIDNDMPTLDDLLGKRCYIGLDLAAKSDITSKVLLFPFEVEGKTHYYCHSTHYLPEAAVTDGRNAAYKGWERDGSLRVTSGNVVDYGAIEDDILEDVRRYDVIEIAYDPWQAAPFIQSLQKLGSLPLVEVRMNVASISEPLKELDALTRNQRLHYRDPVMFWMASNVIVTIDKNENIYPDKAKSANKIDGIVAATLALARALLTHTDQQSPYETRGIVSW